MSSNVATLGARTQPAVQLAGISHVALLVADLAAAREFYRDVMGFGIVGSDVLPSCGHHALVTTASGQLVALCEGDRDPGLSETGIHQGYRVSAAARDEIVARLQWRGVTLHRYKEDRPAEDADNFYVFDPFGNRLQLVVTRNDKQTSARRSPLIAGIDHACVQAADVEWEEKFYVGHLGLPVDHVVGWRTADYARARAWGEGKDPMAPGCRRWDKRYNVMHGKDPVPRPNVQLFVRAGDAVLGIYLADTHFQEPPEENIVGLPRIAFAVAPQDLDRLAERLADWGPMVGPVTHPAGSPRARSLFFKDAGSNFLEFCC
jgi:catechol 2,3-dioxygenase-like lactoylglutathione lyase family enzyme